MQPGPGLKDTTAGVPADITTSRADYLLRIAVKRTAIAPQARLTAAASVSCAYQMSGVFENKLSTVCGQPSSWSHSITNYSAVSILPLELQENPVVAPQKAAAANWRHD
ncbi:hypothetical protein NPX13_g8163 [Xylaria arbuscula]|uniref:Uncharacterized protein n=1 Tax=Xylaria arbuscula TaxID=114810 RepID=A0A9W8TJP8_9PEZI|nr:hypothetical protein NPX13_g8163 [Xylaria arbuscula]